MTISNVITFLQISAARSDLLEYLKTKSKDEVIATASQIGSPFTETEFNSLVWNLEVYLAEKRKEKFDASFSLWSTMWGKYYLEYLVLDLIPSFEEADLRAVMSAGIEGL